MSYAVKEVFFTLQGEGARAGRAAVFCRFSGCNLWTGREEDRASVACWFCDTDFVGMDGDNGGRYASALELAQRIEMLWKGREDIGHSLPYVVFTGGEPLLQLDAELIEQVKRRGFEIAVETNGTILPPQGIDWLTVSPKNLNRLVVKSGQELKLLYPFDISPQEVSDLKFENFYLSPLTEGEESKTRANCEAAIRYCLDHTQWRLTMQYHKIWKLP